MNFSFEDTGPFSNQPRAQGSTCVQFHSEITLIQSYPLSPCVTTLWHWMIKYSWKNVQGVCFPSTLLCICKTCDQMFMPADLCAVNFWAYVFGVPSVFGENQTGAIFKGINMGKAQSYSANYIPYYGSNKKGSRLSMNS